MHEQSPWRRECCSLLTPGQGRAEITVRRATLRGSRSRRMYMAGKNTAVFGIYPTYGALDGAVESLRASGFRNTDISVLFPENVGTKDFGHEKNTKAPEGAATGGTTGAILGGALGWLAGIGALAIPGIGPFIAAGPIVAALAGVGAGSVVG